LDNIGIREDDSVSLGIGYFLNIRDQKLEAIDGLVYLITLFFRAKEDEFRVALTSSALGLDEALYIEDFVDTHY